jgi:hypothetical protein
LRERNGFPTHKDGEIEISQPIFHYSLFNSNLILNHSTRNLPVKYAFIRRQFELKIGFLTPFDFKE